MPRTSLAYREYLPKATRKCVLWKTLQRFKKYFTTQIHLSLVSMPHELVEVACCNGGQEKIQQKKACTMISLLRATEVGQASG